MIMKDRDRRQVLWVNTLHVMLSRIFTCGPNAAPEGITSSEVSSSKNRPNFPEKIIVKC